ncbi:MAG: hypothetical protein HQM09_19320 [Candidatus Riflebacteria bacterium]|nr:hypothetical protein [Candidatus Riflebacteria bacterium]
MALDWFSAGAARNAGDANYAPGLITGWRLFFFGALSLGFLLNAQTKCSDAIERLQNYDKYCIGLHVIEVKGELEKLFLEKDGFYQKPTSVMTWPLLDLSKIVGFIFMAVGIKISGPGLCGIATKRQKDAARARFPDQPWLAEGEWDGYEIRAQSGVQLIDAWSFGIIMCGFVSIAWVLYIYKPAAPLILLMMDIPFSLIAVALLGRAAYLTLRQLKYGTPALILSQMPLDIGEGFGASLLVANHLVTKSGVTITLKCERLTTTQSGKHCHTVSDVIHEKTQTVTLDLAQASEGKSLIPFSFDIPSGLPGRDMESNPQHLWTLDVEAPTSGLDLTASFELPVYLVCDPAMIRRRSCD